MILKWFDTKEVDAFADKLIAEVLKRTPPPAEDDKPGRPKKAEKAQRAQDRSRVSALRQADEFARTHPLNVYTKARLANRFKWGLIEAGYPKAQVDELSVELASTMARARRG